MVTADLCQKVKCGILSVNRGDVSMAELYECSAQFGPGALYPCHPDCVKYGSCVQTPASAVSIPAPLSGKPTVEILPPLPPIKTNVKVPNINNLTNPTPDIMALATPMVRSNSDCEGAWESLNASIRENPVLSVVALAAVVVLLGMKK